jgi:hypothetical protein
MKLYLKVKLYNIWHQQDQGDVLMLTEGSIWVERPCKGVGDDVRPAKKGGARGEGRCRASPGF